MNERPINVIQAELVGLERQGKQLTELLTTYETCKGRRNREAINEIQAWLEIGAALQKSKDGLQDITWQDWLDRYAPFGRTTAWKWITAAQRFIAKYGNEWADDVHLREQIHTVADVMRMTDVQHVKTKVEAVEFSLAAALRLIGPSLRLHLEDVQRLPAEDQSALKAKLEPLHGLYLQLPTP